MRAADRRATDPGPQGPTSVHRAAPRQKSCHQFARRLARFLCVCVCVCSHSAHYATQRSQAPFEEMDSAIPQCFLERAATFAHSPQQKRSRHLEGNKRHKAGKCRVGVGVGVGVSEWWSGDATKPIFSLPLKNGTGSRWAVKCAQQFRPGVAGPGHGQACLIVASSTSVHLALRHCICMWPHTLYTPHKSTSPVQERISRT